MTEETRKKVLKTMTDLLMQNRATNIDSAPLAMKILLAVEGDLEKTDPNLEKKVVHQEIEPEITLALPPDDQPVIANRNIPDSLQQIADRVREQNEAS